MPAWALISQSVCFLSGSYSSGQAAKAASCTCVHEQGLAYQENTLLHCCRGRGFGHPQSTSAGTLSPSSVYVPPRCSDASSFVRSAVSSFSSCDNHLGVLLSGESQMLETLCCHMTGPTVANAGLARKPGLRSVCPEMLHPALLLVAGSSPRRAGVLLLWGPVRCARGAELNDCSGRCEPRLVL